jgi:hypothetical protein
MILEGAYNSVRVDRTMIGRGEVAVNDGVTVWLMSTWCMEMGFWSRLRIRFMCLRRRRQLQKDTKA